MLEVKSTLAEQIKCKECESVKVCKYVENMLKQQAQELGTDSENIVVNFRCKYFTQKQATPKRPVTAETAVASVLKKTDENKTAAGQWLRDVDNPEYRICSMCKKPVFEGQNYEFCPKCGALMRRG